MFGSAVVPRPTWRRDRKARRISRLCSGKEVLVTVSYVLAYDLWFFYNGTYNSLWNGVGWSTEGKAKKSAKKWAMTVDDVGCRS